MGDQRQLKDKTQTKKGKLLTSEINQHQPRTSTDELCDNKTESSKERQANEQRDKPYREKLTD